ncbi:hypothetical protein ES332_A08G117500v1 [Gossypium tomentosum]|uniref:Uncharacterized protein n=1 Tax=Gossypium tomentosum TaxID=34277 RepID=A0A5D2PGC5_GOSTO|nr:hypothetical protein ES332_A08G117500v1 [Gossypium tomentosum]
MVPERLLPSRSTSKSDFALHNSLGIEPDNLLLLKLRCLSLEQFSISGGMLPEKWLFESSKDSTWVHFPSQGGSGPESWFVSAENVSIGKLESSSGKDPDSELKDSINIIKFRQFPSSAGIEPLSSV